MDAHSVRIVSQSVRMAGWERLLLPHMLAGVAGAVGEGLRGRAPVVALQGAAWIAAELPLGDAAGAVRAGWGMRTEALISCRAISFAEHRALWEALEREHERNRRLRLIAFV